MISGQPYYNGSCGIDPYSVPNTCVIVLSLSSIAVTPANPSIARGTTQQFKATGNCRDNTTRDVTDSVTWTSSNTAIATISNAVGSKGVATSVAVGQTTIKAASGSISGSTGLTVPTATQVQLVSIVVIPSNRSIARGTTQQFKATGQYNDNTTRDVTASVIWSSSNTAVATISNVAGSKGLATAVAAGTSTIKAVLDSISGSAGLTVPTATPTPPPATTPSFRDLKLFIPTSPASRYPDRFKFDVVYSFYGDRTDHDNTYQIEIKVVPPRKHGAFAQTSFAPPTKLNYTAGQGSQMIEGQEYRIFSGTITVNAPAQGQLPRFDNLQFIAMITGGPPGEPPLPDRLRSISKNILLEKKPYKHTKPIPECTGAAGAKNDDTIGAEIPLGWLVGETVLTLNGSDSRKVSVGQEIKVDTNPLPGVGARGVRWVKLWYWNDHTKNYQCIVHWWCEGFSNKHEGGNQYAFRYTLTANQIKIRIP